MASDWICVPQSYAVSKNYLSGFQTYEHPLKLHVVTMVDSKGTKQVAKDNRSSFSSSASSRASSSASLLGDTISKALDGTDPLSQFARQDQELLLDPLSQMASEYENLKKKTKKREKLAVGDVLNWSSKRLGILNQFTTSEKLSISTSFLSVSLAGTEGIKSQTIVADKTKFRLEQLDDFEDGDIRHMIDLTQQEYIQRIEQLNEELVHSWNGDQRVKALKIVIQCSKMLTDTSVLSFYPSQFVLITDILDIFGRLVYDRLSAKAKSSAIGGAAGAPADKSKLFESIHESARDTCQNWFFKVASIRELIPRLYVEMALIKCYEFLSPIDFDVIMFRLTKMMRGIGDPLVATYARCYLVRVGLTLSQHKEFIRENFRDFLSIYHLVYSGTIRSELNRQRIDITTYITLFGPALDYILQALVHQSNLFTDEILQKSKEIKNNGPLLISILNAFKPEFIAANALDFVQLLSNSNSEGISKGQLFRALGSNVSGCPPLLEQRVPFLNAAFHTINTFTDFTEYIKCIESWAQFIAENFPIHVINNFLGDVTLRTSNSKSHENHYTQLQNILYKILQYFKNTAMLLVQEHFLPYIDLFKKDSIKIEVCKTILTFLKNNNEECTSDAIVTNALMYIGKILNDSVTAHTVEDERRQITQLINNFVRKVNFGQDFEGQLSFYVEARGTFANLDAVYITLVHAVNKLAMDTRSIMKSQHTKKTTAFVKACVAFCFITIPSITSVQVQMDLYLISGQVALLNHCLGQADACLEAALQLVVELPRFLEVEGKMRSLETYLVSYLSNMLDTLVIVPDSPDQGVLYLFRLLLDVLGKFPFEPHSTGPATVYLHALDMLYVQSLEEFPYHIPNVICNDELYGHDPKFVGEVNDLCVQVVEQFLNQLKTLANTKQFHSQSILALELLLRIVRYADLRREQTFQLALNLWLLATKSDNQMDVKQILRTFKSIEEIYKQVIITDEQRGQSIAQLILRIQSK